MLILLHGVRSNEDDLFALTPYLDERFCIVSARAPQALGLGQYGWYHVNFLPDRIEKDAREMEQARRQLIAFIREAITAYEVDPRQVYLMGFSQGAIMSLAAILTAPELFAGAVVMSGSLPDEVLSEAAAPEQLKGISLLVVHGLYDDIIPIAQARRMSAYLTGLPVNMEFRDYPMRHQISDQSLDDVAGWLIARLDGEKAL